MTTQLLKDQNPPHPTPAQPARQTSSDPSVVHCSTRAVGRERTGPSRRSRGTQGHTGGLLSMHGTVTANPNQTPRRDGTTGYCWRVANGATDGTTHTSDRMIKNGKNSYYHTESKCKGTTFRNWSLTNNLGTSFSDLSGHFSYQSIPSICMLPAAKTRNLSKSQIPTLRLRFTIFLNFAVLTATILLTALCCTAAVSSTVTLSGQKLCCTLHTNAPSHRQGSPSPYVRADDVTSVRC